MTIETLPALPLGWEYTLPSENQPHLIITAGTMGLAIPYQYHQPHEFLCKVILHVIAVNKRVFGRD